MYVCVCVCVCVYVCMHACVAHLCVHVCICFRLLFQSQVVSYWRRAAEHGHPEASVGLAELLATGQGVNQSFVEATL